MSTSPLAIVILAAGQGTRMRSDTHKVLHKIGGKPMLHHLLDMTESLNPARQLVVVGALADQVEAAVAGRAERVDQTAQLGTGHAVKMCIPHLRDFDGDLLVLYGDVPLISATTIARMQVARSAGTALVVLGFQNNTPTGYGRLLTDAEGNVLRIVEEKDASDTERAVTYCNSGLMLMDARWAQETLSRLTNDNAAGEYYLTDLVAAANDEGQMVAATAADAAEVAGVNDRADLAAVEALFQARARAHHINAGVTMIAPDTVFVSADTVTGRDVIIEPHVVIGPGVTIENGVTIKAFSHLEGCTVRTGASVGPYARLRPGADIGAGAKIGNFVEIKKSQLDTGVKVSHLSYIGDAHIGEGANIGAGTITCNYDGFNKYQTSIGAGAFIGSNTALVAPVTVGAGATVGAGSVITKPVNADALAVTRAPQKGLKGWSADFRARKQKGKD